MSAVKEEILPEHRQQYNFYLSLYLTLTLVKRTVYIKMVQMVNIQKISKATSQSNFTMKLKWHKNVNVMQNGKHMTEGILYFGFFFWLFF